jgi:hypothetical protein
MKKNICFVVVVLAAWLFVVFVWPTAYRYEKFVVSNRAYLIRISRFNDSAAKLTNEGWVALRPRIEEKPEQWDGYSAPAPPPAP